MKNISPGCNSRPVTAQRRVFAGGCLLIAIAQVIYEAAKIGPWS